MQRDLEAHRAAVRNVMTRLTSGDAEAMSEFFELANSPVRRMLLNALQSRGMWIDRDRLEDITRDAVIELIHLAPAWRPDGGAAPWTWARLRLVKLAFDRIGILADDIDDVQTEAWPTIDLAHDGRSALSVLVTLAPTHTGAQTLTSALTRATSERDGDVWLEVLSERETGNRSPAVTVAKSHDLSPENVRKICQRVRQQLKDLARVEPEFQTLLALPAVAA
jgi:DNA-directed RNA polymerase specialized sigma24 family protein